MPSQSSPAQGSPGEPPPSFVADVKSSTKARWDSSPANVRSDDARPAWSAAVSRPSTFHLNVARWRSSAPRRCSTSEAAIGGSHQAPSTMARRYVARGPVRTGLDDPWSCLTPSMTFAVVSVHSPKPEHRAAVMDSMQRYSRVAREQPGLEWTGVVDDASGRLVGIALWESEEAAAAARPALMAEVGDDPFADWDEQPIDGLRGPVR